MTTKWMINSNFWGSPKKFTLFVVDFDLGNQIEPILSGVFSNYIPRRSEIPILTYSCEWMVLP